MNWLAYVGLLITIAVAPGCGDDSQTNSDSGSGSGATSMTSANTTSSMSTCEAAGGMCSCAGSCDAGFELAPPTMGLTCPQPPDSSGACSQECCLPVGGSGTSASSSGTASSSGSTGAADCPCPDDLPSCPDAMLMCDGMEGMQCCGASGRLNECSAGPGGSVWAPIC